MIKIMLPYLLTAGSYMLFTQPGRTMLWYMYLGYTFRNHIFTAAKIPLLMM